MSHGRQGLRQIPHGFGNQPGMQPASAYTPSYGGQADPRMQRIHPNFLGGGQASLDAHTLVGSPAGLHMQPVQPPPCVLPPPTHYTARGKALVGAARSAASGHGGGGATAAHSSHQGGGATARHSGRMHARPPGGFRPRAFGRYNWGGGGWNWWGNPAVSFAEPCGPYQAWETYFSPDGRGPFYRCVWIG
jgi:hypothetical protein